MNGRITLRLDRGLGWTKPLVVAYCAVCGTELARSPDPAAATRAARRRRCPVCGTRAGRRLPGTTSLATDLALTRCQPERSGRRRWPPDRHPAPRPVRAGRR
jgi:DNA-directed RNA polymerase subunit RPC12/RpoP